MKNTKIINITYISLAAALIVICSWLCIPISVAITLQTFGVLTVSALLGAKRALAAVLTYIALGAVGLPVFSGLQGGIGHLMGVGGGYIIGFVLTALIVGISADRNGRKTKPLIISMTLGVLACYALGTSWYAALYTSGEGIIHIILTCILPFIIPDAIKIFAAVVCVKRLNQTKYFH